MTSPQRTILLVRIELALLAIAMLIQGFLEHPYGIFVLSGIALWLCYTLGWLQDMAGDHSYKELVILEGQLKRGLKSVPSSGSGEPQYDTLLAALTERQCFYLGKIKPCSSYCIPRAAGRCTGRLHPHFFTLLQRREYTPAANSSAIFFK